LLPEKKEARSLSDYGLISLKNSHFLQTVGERLMKNGLIISLN